ncbi:MAG: hypothetical protein ACP5Q5_00840 [Brevinematia bacterium]
MRDDDKVYLRNYKISPLDTSSNEIRYRVTFSLGDVEINSNVRKFISLLEKKEGGVVTEIRKVIGEELGIDEKSVQNVLNLLEQKKLLTFNFKEKEENFTFRNRMENFWLRIKLFDISKLAGFLKIFEFFLKKPVVIGVTTLFCLLEAFLFYFSFFSKHITIKYYGIWDYFIIFVIYPYFKTVFHEMGHAVALAKYNVPSKDGIGFGFYYFMFVMYTDTHESWNLPRKERAIVSIAGFYFELIFLLPLFFTFFLTQSGAIKDYLILFPLFSISTFNPFLKMDGYWFLSDILGIVSLQTKIKNWIKSIVKKEKKSPFSSYPPSIQRFVIIYLFIFYFFMFSFLSGFYINWIKITLNLDSYIWKPLLTLVSSGIKGENIKTFNIFLRNSGIWIGGFSYLIFLLLKFFKLVFGEKNKEVEKAI